MCEPKPVPDLNLLEDCGKNRGICPKCGEELGPVPRPEGSPYSQQEWEEIPLVKNCLKCTGCEENYSVIDGHLYANRRQVKQALNFLF